MRKLLFQSALEKVCFILLLLFLNWMEECAPWGSHGNVILSSSTSNSSSRTTQQYSVWPSREFYGCLASGHPVTHISSACALSSFTNILLTLKHTWMTFILLYSGGGGAFIIYSKFNIQISSLKEELKIFVYFALRFWIGWSFYACGDFDGRILSTTFFLQWF